MNASDPYEAITDKDYADAMRNRDRPLTDRPIGGNTAHKRAASAAASEAFSHDASDRLAELMEARAKDRSERERYKLARRVATHAAALAALNATGCGTNNGWLAHRGRNEWPCAPCRDAHRNHPTTDPQENR